MSAPDDAAMLAASMLNAGWLLRHYASGRTPHYRAERARAILALGLAVRKAFTRSDDFEPLLIAFADAVRPRDDRPF